MFSYGYGPRSFDVEVECVRACGPVLGGLWSLRPKAVPRANGPTDQQFPDKVE